MLFLNKVNKSLVQAIKTIVEVVANNHFIWNGKEWMGGLRKGKLIAGGYWFFGGLRSVNTFLSQTISGTGDTSDICHNNTK